jgi:hypothetical protein
MTNTPSNYGYATGGRALRMCLRCGCLVGDTDLHDQHHDKADGLQELSVVTATNLMATLNALVGETQ